MPLLLDKQRIYQPIAKFYKTMDTQALCGLKAADFQKEIGGKKTDLYILRNANGCELAITNYGGALVAIMVPDRKGEYANVIQGHDNIDSCVNSPEPFLSTLVGRYGNRIAKGKFQLNGKEYHLAVNNGPNHLHGGPTGFHARVWDAEQIDNHTLVLRYVSAYYEEGFPGELTMTVRYTWTDDNELVIDYRGTTNKKTVVNMTSHGFFSLQGLGNPTPTAMDTICEINADLFFSGKSGISNTKSKRRKKAASMLCTELDNQIIGTLLFSNN